MVLALTAILMGVLFVPLSRSLDLAARGNAQIQGQDNVRVAMRKIRDELAKAMVVYDQAPIYIYGYDVLGTQDNRPTLLAGSAPTRFATSSAALAFRLPKQKYYCLNNDHYVTPADFDLIYGAGAGTDDGVILTDTCPRHPGSRIELRAAQPQQPSSRIVAYFVGLKNPGMVDNNAGTNTGLPVYDNLMLLKRSFLQSPPQGYGGTTLNTYTLYRAEFDPAHPAYQTFPILTGGDPNFFYDNTSVTVGAQTMPRWQWWLDIANPLIDIETGDVVRFVKNRSGSWLPQSLVNFNPAPVTGEIAQPNQDVVTTGVLRFADAPPIQYELDYGSLVSSLNHERLPIPDGLTMGPSATMTNVGPRIEVVTTGGVAFDSTNTLLRARLVAFDPVSGRITLGHRRGAANEPPLYTWLPTGAGGGGIVADPSMPGDYNVEFSADGLIGMNGMPSSFGRAVTHYAGAANVRLVPGSETVELSGVGKMRRLNNTRVPLEARADLEPDQYLINYDTGVLQLPRIAGVDWSTVGVSGPELRISYSFQTNERNDIVRVSYSTKELQAATLGTVQYTRRRAEALPFEVTERVALRNLRK